ncbi:MAG: O-antigen ligase family protein [Neisseriaceae bacterium]
MKNISFSSHKVETVIDVLLLFFFSTLLTVSQRNFYFVVPALLLFGSLGFCLYQAVVSGFSLSREQRLVSYTFAIYSLVCLSIGLLHGDPFNSIKFELLPIVLLPVFWLFTNFLRRAQAVYCIFPIATLLTALVAGYDKYGLGIERALEPQQPVIPAAGIVMTFSLFCLVFFFKSYQKNVSYSLVALTSFVFGLIASILTESRGAWICLPVVLVGLLWHFWPHIPAFVKKLLIPITISLLLIALVFLNTGIVHRLEQVKTDLVWYFVNHNANSSIGLRFEFWKSALDGFLQKPLWGWGVADYLSLKELQVERGLIIPQALPFVHAHNQFLDVLVKKGIFGLLSTIGLFLLPMRFYIRYWSKSSLVSMLGCILIFNVFTFCLTDSFLRLPLGMIFYVVTNYLLLGFLLRHDAP